MYTLLYGANQVIFATAQGPITGIPKGIERGPLGQAPLPEAEGEPPRVDPKSSLVPTKDSSNL